MKYFTMIFVFLFTKLFSTSFQISELDEVHVNY